MRTLKTLAAGASAAAILTACGGGGSSLPNGWESAAQTCAMAYTFDQVIQSGGEGFVPERVATIPDELTASAQEAANASSEYDQLQLLVGKLVYSIEQGDQSAVLDLVAVEGECEQLGFGTEPPQ